MEGETDRQPSNHPSTWLVGCWMYGRSARCAASPPFLCLPACCAWLGLRRRILGPAVRVRPSVRGLEAVFQAVSLLLSSNQASMPFCEAGLIFTILYSYGLHSSLDSVTYCSKYSKLF